MRGSSSLLERRGSPYAALYTRFAAATETLRAGEPGPEAVAQVVLAALRARRPHARYKAAVSPATGVVASLPDWGRDLAKLRLYGLGSPGHSREPGPGSRR